MTRLAYLLGDGESLVVCPGEPDKPGPGSLSGGELRGAEVRVLGDLQPGSRKQLSKRLDWRADEHHDALGPLVTTAPARITATLRHSPALLPNDNVRASGTHVVKATCQDLAEQASEAEANAAFS